MISKWYVSLPTSSKWWGDNFSWVRHHPLPRLRRSHWSNKTALARGSPFFFEVTVRLQKKGCGTQWGWEKNISLNPSQLHTPTWILQNESQKVSPSFGIYVLYKEYSIEEHTKFRITGQKHFTLGVINPIWYTALRTPGLFFLRMTILNAETQDNFLGNCWQMILHPRNSTVTCRSTWPRQPLRWGNGIMIKPSALTPNASPLRDTGIWIYNASSSANIFLRGGRCFCWKLDECVWHDQHACSSQPTFNKTDMLGVRTCEDDWNWFPTQKRNSFRWF